jgi:hypothetical protein
MDIDVDPNSLREMQSALTRFNADLMTDRRDLQALLNSVQWSDARFTEFSGYMMPSLGHMEQVSQCIFDMTLYLGDKAEIIERYLGR